MTEKQNDSRGQQLLLAYLLLTQKDELLSTIACQKLA